MVRKFFKYLMRVLATVLLLLLLYLLSAVTFSLIPTNPEQPECNEKQSIFIASNGLHLDFIFPREQFTPQWYHDIYLTKTAKYLGFGWGDKDFYLNTPTWKDLSMLRAIKATFIKTDAALHITAYQLEGEHWLEIQLCESQLMAILDHIHQSFKTDENGHYLIIAHPGYSPQDCFFEAHGNYNFLQTCNQWVNQGLKKANVPTSVWSPFDRGVLYHLR